MQLHDGGQLLARMAKLPERFDAVHRTPVKSARMGWWYLGLKKCREGCRTAHGGWT